MAGLTYDAGALVAAERGRNDIWHLHEEAIVRGERPTVPAGVLGQAWRGGPQARLSKLLKSCQVEALNELRTRAAGVACGRAGTSDVIDASVVVGAIARGDVVVTSDPDDIRRVAEALGARLQVFTI
jgi:hypothetical protein